MRQQTHVPVGRHGATTGPPPGHHGATTGPPPGHTFPYGTAVFEFCSLTRRLLVRERGDTVRRRLTRGQLEGGREGPGFPPQRRPPRLTTRGCRGQSRHAGPSWRRVWKRIPCRRREKNLHWDRDCPAEASDPRQEPRRLQQPRPWPAVAWAQPMPALGTKDGTKDEEGGREMEGGEPSAVDNGTRGHHAVTCGARSRGHRARTGVHSAHSCAGLTGTPGAAPRAPESPPAPLERAEGLLQVAPPRVPWALPRAAWGCASEQHWPPHEDTVPTQPPRCCLGPSANVASAVRRYGIKLCYFV